MRKTLPLLAALALFPALPALPAQAAGGVIHANSRITDVTVYPDRALVMRSATLDLAPGTYQVVFERLPLSVEGETLRVRATGTARATLAGFDLQTRYLGKPPSKEVAALETRLTGFNDQLRALADSRAIHERQLNLLKVTASQSGESLAKQLAIGKAKLADWRELMSFLQGQQSNETKAILTIDQQYRKIANQREGVNIQLGKLRGFRREEVRQVPVTLDVKQGGSLKVDLEYVIEGARWSPTYDARLSREGDKLTWGYRALVSQQTGEDWRDVHLTVSTAQPALGSCPPEVPSWFLSVWHPMPAAEAPAPSQAYGGMSAKHARRNGMNAPKPAAEAEDAKEEIAQVTDQGSSVTLEVPRATTVPSDGEPHQAFIGEAEFKAEANYRVVPKVSENAFLEVKTHHEGPWPILPGPVKAYVGHDYVGTTPLAADIVPGEAFSLPMGVDRGIQVKRVRLAKKQGQEGLLSKQNYAEYRYELAFTNYKPRAATLTVLEPVPQATEDAIRIKLEGLGQNARQDEPGQVKWSFKLSPEEKKVLRWGYRVEYPLDTQLTGLE